MFSLPTSLPIPARVYMKIYWRLLRIIKQQTSLQGGAPQLVISWFIILLTIDVSTISPSY